MATKERKAAFENFFNPTGIYVFKVNKKENRDE